MTCVQIHSTEIYVGRTDNVSTGNAVRRFTYDVPPGINTGKDDRVTDELERATDGRDQLN